MHHQEADAERVKARTSGFVRVTNSHNVQLFYCEHFQHDKKAGDYTSDAIDMAKEVLSAAIHVGKWFGAQTLPTANKLQSTKCDSWTLYFVILTWMNRKAP